jgi:hypothetical protein
VVVFCSGLLSIGLSNGHLSDGLSAIAENKKEVRNQNETPKKLALLQLSGLLQ